MKPDALKRFRAKLSADVPTYGMWVTLESASIAEMAVGLGLDWVVIDAEHGHLDWNDIVQHIRASVRSHTLAVVRIAELNVGLIKRALDIGADGVMVPWMETAEQLARAVSYAHYPTQGLRGIGAERATAWGQRIADHVAEAEENVLVIPIIESVTGGRNVPEMLQVPGVDVFYFGPADYSATAGFAGQWEGAGVAEAILAAKDLVRASGRQCGVVATSNENLIQRREQGFRMLGLGMDSGMLLRSLRGALQTVGRDQALRLEAVCENDAEAISHERPLPCAPESFRPDRAEVMNEPGSGPQIEISSGVTFDCLVGIHNQARNLTTGLVTFAPGAVLPYHRHTFGESITLLEGQALVEVEGRRYSLTPLDNVTVPKGRCHTATNLSSERTAVFHIALATHTPTRELIDSFFSKRAMPCESTGILGAEHVTRFGLASRYSPGSDASFVDFCNRELVPGIEMSGGYGEFGKGGRLPAHLHDFDESICIIEGQAVCMVEGRAYNLLGRATALQPRGRIHYFKNVSDARMAMIWFYAGPMPERIVVDSRCADVPNAAWS